MRPSFGLGVLADELRDESDRLHAMDLDDPAASLAEEHCRAALAIGQEHGDRNAEAHSLASLGAVLLDTGRQHEALPLFERAQVLFRDLARTFYEAQMLEKIGDVHLALGETALAGRLYRQALPLLEERMDTLTARRLVEKIGARPEQDH